MSVLIPSDFDVHLFHEGSLFKSYNLFGAHMKNVDGVEGVCFTVWAPNAMDVRLVGDFNEWDGTHYPMRKINEQGIWSLFVPGMRSEQLYKYEIWTKSGQKKLKADPYAFFAEVKPNTASKVYDIGGYEWNDDKWYRKKKRKAVYDRPMFIYELNLASWKKHDDGSFLTYRELVEELIPYIKDHKFTHIELMPIIEHPYDRSWGYQGTGYFSATSRYGTPHDLMYFIDQCHQNDIGVIVDWVPGHFCKDEHGLYMFDGTPTYDYPIEKDRENYIWGTANFDLGKPEVQSFLISSAIFWIENYHIDGFRVDAVANMVYWQNSDELQPNPYAIAFLMKLNEAVFATDETILMIAEDSTDWPMVTGPTYDGGLGFNYKWNMGWMNDILTYMEAGFEERKHLHDKVSFSLIYAYSENFILPFSHDEVVHGKRSLLNKMPGDYWKKFAQFRLLLGYFTSHPGKKLLFMGSEFAQYDEWKDLEQLDWFITDYEMHSKAHQYTKDLIKLYLRSKPLYELDHHQDGFEWIDVNNREQRIFSFIRKGTNNQDQYLVVCNFSPEVYHQYKVGVLLKTRYVEVLNSDDEQYGGSGQVNKKDLPIIDEAYHGKPYHIEMTIPPLGISILRAVKKRGGKKVNDEKKVRSNASSRRKR
ncbi:1,4-alpha-glucan branching enzyme [Bacillus carboniphilus]|uniref:1,4-alpha-glucan branching enzyme GlgB n=1 Tax=Bacillus carboniphilus TaxID=86663 RepID=A0ABY9JU42_9BACI|nr:1,4-alpha-glucan branching enzyme [Bacillus carboniphilus]WLR41206.1 1,4-alpha-glucan branching enzyme [Bacillus carboniphilus]